MVQKQEEKTENWEKLKTLIKGGEKERVNKEEKKLIIGGGERKSKQNGWKKGGGGGGRLWSQIKG